ncbi:MAG: hypothetical protein EOO71_25420 [Myxococcaceae bacterium]|nr:MAG: hypothetical protein EOO71_25420 [Myxococcaceae bacterium]
MRAAIIAGLMAIGMLAGCGGQEAEGDTSMEPMMHEGVAEQRIFCTDNCRRNLDACKRGGTSNNICNAQYDACLDMCLGVSVASLQEN